MFMQNSYAQARAGPMIPLVKQKKFYQTHSSQPFIPLAHQPNIENSPLNIYTGDNGSVLNSDMADKNMTEMNFEGKMKEKSPFNVIKYETKLLKNKEFSGLTNPKKPNKNLQKKNKKTEEDSSAYKRIKLPSYAICLQANIEPKNFSVLKSYYELMARDSHLAILNKRQLLAKIVEASTDRSQSQLATSQLERSDMRLQEKTFPHTNVNNYKNFLLQNPRSRTLVTMGNIRVKEFLERRNFQAKVGLPHEQAVHLVEKRDDTASMESVTTDCIRKSVNNFINSLDNAQGYDVVQSRQVNQTITATDHMVSEKILPMVAMFESHRYENQDSRQQTAKIGSSRSKKQQLDIKTNVYQHPERVSTLKSGSSKFLTSLRLHQEEKSLEIEKPDENQQQKEVEFLQIKELETNFKQKTFTSEMKVDDDAIDQEEIARQLYNLYYNKQVMKPQSFYFSCENAEYRDSRGSSQHARNSKLESLARRQKILQKENSPTNILSITKIAQREQKDRKPIHHSVATSTSQTQIQEEPPFPLNQPSPRYTPENQELNAKFSYEKPNTATSKISETISDFDQLRLSMARKQMMDYVENVTSNPMISQIRVKSGLGVRKAYQNISGKRCTKQGFKYLDNSQESTINGEDYNEPVTDVRHERTHSSIYEQSETNEELIRVSMYKVAQENSIKTNEPALVDTLQSSLMPKVTQEPFIILQWGEPISNQKFGDLEPEQNSMYRSKSRLKPRKVIKRPITQMQNKSTYTTESSRSVGGITGLPPPQNRHLHVNYQLVSDRSVMSKTQVNLFKVDLKAMNNMNTQIDNCLSDLAKSVPSPLNANTTLTAFQNIPSPQFAKDSKVQTADGGKRNPKSTFAENKNMEIPSVHLQGSSRDFNVQKGTPRDAALNSYKKSKSNTFNDEYSPLNAKPQDQSQLENYLSTEREPFLKSQNDQLTKIPTIQANVVRLPKSDSLEDLLLAHLSKPSTNFVKLKTEIHEENRKLAKSALDEHAPLDLIVRNKKQNDAYILNQKQVAVNFVLKMENLFNKRNASHEIVKSVKHQSTQAFETQDSQILAICDQSMLNQHSQKTKGDQKVCKAFSKEKKARKHRFDQKNGALIKSLKPKLSLISSSVIRE